MTSVFYFTAEELRNGRVKGHAWHKNRAAMFIQRIVFKRIIIHHSAFFISILYFLCCWLWPRMFIYNVVLKTCWINKLWNLFVIVFLKVFTKLYLLRWTVSVTRKTWWKVKNKVIYSYLIISYETEHLYHWFSHF